MARSFAPASVSNVACGFDVLGFAVDGLGDVVEATARDEPGVELVSISGDDGRLPLDAQRNTAGVAARSVLDQVGSRRGVVLRLEKGMPLGSGLGSSAASAAAAAHATAVALGIDPDPAMLLRATLEGERVACGTAHPDNATPSVYGGFVLIRSMDPLPDGRLDVVPLPVPDGLACVVVRPQIEVETRAARGLLPQAVPLVDAVRQTANLGALVAALFRGDLALLGRSLEDRFAEPHRAASVPGFLAARDAALSAGALGCSLSGSGPAVFALVDESTAAGSTRAESTAAAMAEAFAAQGTASESMISSVGTAGVRSLG